MIIGETWVYNPKPQSLIFGCRINCLFYVFEVRAVSLLLLYSNPLICPGMEGGHSTLRSPSTLYRAMHFSEGLGCILCWGYRRYQSKWVMQPGTCQLEMWDLQSIINFRPHINYLVCILKVLLQKRLIWWFYAFLEIGSHFEPRLALNSRCSYFNLLSEGHQVCISTL